MLDRGSIAVTDTLRQAINKAYRCDERVCIEELIEHAKLGEKDREAIDTRARELVINARIIRKSKRGLDSILTEYALSSDEGVALMCLAEAFLRVPDTYTIDKLIKDKISRPDWRANKSHHDSFFVNATTWALMLTGKVLSPEKIESKVSKALVTLLSKGSGSVVRKAANQAMKVMSRQFVMGRTIDEALERAKKREEQGFLYSYDMLGEAALTQEDANLYFKAYLKAIDTIGRSVSKDVYKNPGISIKLSALHPRYHFAQKDRVIKELTPVVLELAIAAKKYDIGLTIDAEEAERLDISLDVIEHVFSDNKLNGWDGFGLAVQSYQKRAFFVLDWVANLARSHKRRIMVRLIKGAYWDSEIKKTQMQGLEDYPVFTRKSFTDVAFQACAKKLMTMTDEIYPQFATHNAYSVAMILNLVGEYRDFEFQCLHGMGRELYEQIVPKDMLNIPCRIYAPVGSHEDLLPYLVRRLLENGANSSFVNRLVDENQPLDSLIADPVALSESLLDKINHNIPLPRDIFLPVRGNSHGIDLTDPLFLAKLQKDTTELSKKQWQAMPLVKGKAVSSESCSVYRPQDTSKEVGQVSNANSKDIENALQAAKSAFSEWSSLPVTKRVQIIERIGQLLEQNQNEIYALTCLEAGKTWSDMVAEIREAVDFCLYYAKQAINLMDKPMELSGYTGEKNTLTLHPRGVVVCISPWNFPLAIFVGQIVAALATGNCVIAKPAEQTPLISFLAVKLMHEAGVIPGAVQLLPGDGASVGGELVRDSRVDAVIFTGSVPTAHIISKTLAERSGAIVPLIAETGGQNAMIVDSSALLEQVVVDVLISAFGSAGQRCSALRVLYVQEDIYPRLIELLSGAMAELKVGDPAFLSTDVGPVIDKDAYTHLSKYIKAMKKTNQVIFECTLDDDCKNGYFIAPIAYAINSIKELKEEMFGPILHVAKFKADALDTVIDDINGTGYGLTLGIHSRISSTVEYIQTRIHAGNCYVNRNMTGAIVGLQPFGGEGLSGTGPKAGGPHYLPRLCHERTCTIDTTAAGGNASLMSLSDDI